MGFLRNYHIALISRAIVVIVFCALSGGAPKAYAQGSISREYQIKAAFLYNFTKFVEWPADRFANENAPMILCVMGKDPFGAILETSFVGKTTKGRAIIIKRNIGIDNLELCHLLFVSSSEQERVPQIVAALSGASVLTIADMNRFANQGGSINLVRRRNKIRFEINPDAVNRARLTLGSRLLELATIVTE